MPDITLPSELDDPLSAPLVAPTAPPAPRADLVRPAAAADEPLPAQGHLHPLLCLFDGEAGPVESWLLAADAHFCRAALENAGGRVLEGLPEDLGAIRIDARLGSTSVDLVGMLLERHRGIRELPTAQELARLEAARPMTLPEACPTCRRKADWRASSLPGRFLCGGCWTGWGAPADAQPPAAAPPEPTVTSSTWPEGQARPVPPEACPSCGADSWQVALAGNYLCGYCLTPWGPAGAAPPETAPEDPCRRCDGVRWWRGADGRVRCGDCSPPGRLEVVEWFDVELVP